MRRCPRHRHAAGGGAVAIDCYRADRSCGAEP